MTKVEPKSGKYHGIFGIRIYIERVVSICKFSASCNEKEKKQEKNSTQRTLRCAVWVCCIGRKPSRCDVYWLKFRVFVFYSINNTQIKSIHIALHGRCARNQLYAMSKDHSFEKVRKKSYWMNEAEIDIGGCWLHTLTKHNSTYSSSGHDKIKQCDFFFRIYLLSDFRLAHIRTWEPARFFSHRLSHSGYRWIYCSCVIFFRFRIHRHRTHCAKNKREKVNKKSSSCRRRWAKTWTYCLQQESE